VVGNAAYQLTFVGFAGHNGRFTRLIWAQQLLAVHHAETTIFFHPTMTGDAFFVKNRFDLRVEMDGLFAQTYPVGQQKQQQQQADAKQEIAAILEDREFHLAISVRLGCKQDSN
jgi:hypothetical protein